MLGKECPFNPVTSVTASVGRRDSGTEGQRDGGMVGQKDERWRTHRRKSFLLVLRSCSNGGGRRGNVASETDQRRSSCTSCFDLFFDLVHLVLLWIQLRFWTQLEGSTICPGHKGIQQNHRRRRDEQTSGHSWYPWRWTGHTGSVFESSSRAKTDEGIGRWRV